MNGIRMIDGLQTYFELIFNLRREPHCSKVPNFSSSHLLPYIRYALYIHHHKKSVFIHLQLPWQGEGGGNWQWGVGSVRGFGSGREVRQREGIWQLERCLVAGRGVRVCSMREGLGSGRGVCTESGICKEE